MPFTYHVESEVMFDQAVPAVVKRNEAGQSVAILTTPDATPEEVALIAFVLNGKARGRFVGVTTPPDATGGYTRTLWSDEQPGRDFQAECEAGLWTD